MSYVPTPPPTIQIPSPQQTVEVLATSGSTLQFAAVWVVAGLIVLGVFALWVANTRRKAKRGN